jgi:hypothetical protein
MKVPARATRILALVLLFAASPGASGMDARKSLQAGNIESLRVNLAPAGAGLGFELEIDGGDPRLESLFELLLRAEPGGDHKCPNRGALRFFMRDGSVVALGLLPGHTPGDYGLRLYEDERLLGTYRVSRGALLDALEGLGVPTEDPAFRE